MCRLESGVILKDRCVLAEGFEQSHRLLLESLGMKDSLENAMTKFVRAELVPLDEEWWTDHKDWEFVVDQDEVPEWFQVDPEKYENQFRTAVAEWLEKHRFIEQEVEELSSGYYLLKDCKVQRLSGKVEAELIDTTVEEMRNTAFVTSLRGNSNIRSMKDDSQVGIMQDHSQVEYMYGTSNVKSMQYDSQVGNMHGNSQVVTMCDDSKIGNMSDDSRVEVMDGDSRVEFMRHDSKVVTMYDHSCVLEISGNASVPKK